VTDDADNHNHHARRPPSAGPTLANRAPNTTQEPNHMTTGVSQARTRTRRASTAAANTTAARATTPVVATTDPVAVARHLALLAAELPGTDRRRQLARLAAVEAACDDHADAIDGAARAAIILGQAVDWAALSTWLRRTRRWSARRFCQASPAEILEYLERGLAVPAEAEAA
jgi:hypothetical protein